MTCKAPIGNASSKFKIQSSWEAKDLIGLGVDEIGEEVAMVF
ncbi:hypothetical protein [Helicobacter enhydrae]|nr:hypothetical protein [Helicobacter enhydrae]